MTLRAPAAALLTALTTAVVAAAPPALAAGRMRAGDRHLSIESQIVRVDVEDGLVTTEVEQVFRNDADEPAEAVYDLPLPPDSAFSGLAIWVDGQPVEGEVVERSRAEAIYREETGVEVTPLREGKSQAERLVAIRSVDPALLQVHGRLLRLRVSPVPARGTQRVRARYVQPLRGEGETARVIYPLAHEGVEAAVAGRLDCRVRVRSSAPVARVYSPSHPEADVANPVPGSAFELAFSERGARLDRDLEVRIDRLQQPGPRLRVLAAREPGARLGTAQLALTPWLPPVYRSPRRDVVLVVDDSASMDDRRARAAALVDAALAGLDDGDRFTVVRLGLSARPWQRRLVPLSAANRRAARAFVAAAGRRGQADPRVLAGALARLAKSDRGGRPLDVVLLTDPALSDHPQALDEVARRARATGVRVFAVELGGSTAPQAPLARLARRTGGTARALNASAPVGALAARLVADVETPAIRAPRLTLEGVALTQLHPTEPPAVLRVGEPIYLYGRYATPGRGRAVLEGLLPNGQRVRWALGFELPDRGDHLDVQRLWARAAADDLEAALAAPGLTEARRLGLEEELLAASLAGPIVSSATSLLVLENEALFEDHGLARTNRDRVARERAAQEGRAEAIDLDVQARGPAGTLGTVAARPAERVWEFDLGIGGGGGAGAGDPLTLLVLLGGVAAAARRRRALAEGA